MTESKSIHRQSRRWAADPRCDSHLAWLRKVITLTLDEPRVPSDSNLIRRALSCYAEHWADMLAAGRVEGLTGPHPQDADAERALLAEYSAITTAPQPTTLVDEAGRVLTWQEALARGIQRRDARSLSIPAPEGDAVVS